MATRIDDFLITSRTFSEYRAMFALSESELRGARILDCPSGGGSFTAETREKGIRVVSADPALAHPRADLVRLARRDLDTGSAFMAENPGLYEWDFFGSMESHRAEREAAHTRFSSDYLNERASSYVAGALPLLPFADCSFTLVLSGYFLFTYADRLDLACHVAAALELARVAAGEVRVYPLLGFADEPYGQMPELLSRLAEDGVAAEVRPVEYRMQKGAHEMLALRRERG